MKEIVCQVKKPEKLKGDLKRSILGPQNLGAGPLGIPWIRTCKLEIPH